MEDRIYNELWPFSIELFYKESHILNSERPIYLQTKIQRVDIEVDTNTIVSDVTKADYNINQVTAARLMHED